MDLNIKINHFEEFYHNYNAAFSLLNAAINAFAMLVLIYKVMQVGMHSE